jgi:hypothetical protein
MSQLSPIDNIAQYAFIIDLNNIRFSLIKNRDNSVGLATGYWPEDRGSIPDRGKFSVSLHSVQTGSGAHPISYPMATRSSIYGGKAAGA